MMIASRNGFAVRDLPSGCVRVQYLEGTGTQYIVTGVSSFPWPYLEIICKVNGNYNAQYSAGIIGNSNGGSRWQGIAPRNTTSVDFRGYDDITTITESTTNDYVRLVFDGPNKIAYAGESSATLLSGANAGAGYCIWGWYGRMDPIAMSVKYVKIGTSSTNLLFDAIPVRKNGVGYMYDRVSKTLFGNQGTGTFIIGPDGAA